MSIDDTSASSSPPVAPASSSSQSAPVFDRPNRFSVALAIVVFSAIAIGLIWVPSWPVKAIGVLLLIWIVKTWILELLYSSADPQGPRRWRAARPASFAVGGGSAADGRDRWRTVEIAI